MIQDNNINTCYFCGSRLIQIKSILGHPFFQYNCPICGEYVTQVDYKNYFKNELRDETAFYLYFYNKLRINNNKHICCIVNKENLDNKKEEYDNKLNEVFSKSNIFYIDEDYIKSKYPTKFSEKIDYLANALVKKAKRLDKKISMKLEEISSACSIKRINNSNVRLDNEDAWSQILKILSYLCKKDFIFNKSFSRNNLEIQEISLTPECWMYVENLEREESKSKKIFIALRFSDETKNIREAIKQGIGEAGYDPVIIDEKIYNKQVVPEIFRRIRESKMLVMDATFQNYGSYYEAGYALG